MSFLAPLLLIGLPLALVPVIIHLIYLLRRRQVRWAAMMFLRKAQKMNKGLSKLRQYVILAARVLAVAALVLALARPLAGGLLGFTGGAPETVLVLLDRSASMETRLLSTGQSKREAGLAQVREAAEAAYGKRSKLVLIDSALGDPVVLSRAADLQDVPQSGPTDTGADIPGLLQRALDYMSVNETGRTDIWLISDLQRGDWDPEGNRWGALNSALGMLSGVRFHVLAYDEVAAGDMGVVVEAANLEEGSGGAHLVLDVRIFRDGTGDGAVRVPVRLVVQGVGSQIEVELEGAETVVRGMRVPLDDGVTRGWGRVELPADGALANNVYHFVFAEPPALHSVVVAEDEKVAEPLVAALASPAERSREYKASTLSPARAAEIAWEETALVVWQAPLPEEDSILGKQLVAHVEAGRRLLLLPAVAPGAHGFRGVRWAEWEDLEEGQTISWWRSDVGLLAATRSGEALPVGETEVRRWCSVEGEFLPLARLEAEERGTVILAQGVGEDGPSGAYFLGTLPVAGTSSLARDGVVLYALLHRALADGGAALGQAQLREAGKNALPGGGATWRPWGGQESTGENAGTGASLAELGLRGGVVEHTSGGMAVALNRPLEEDDRARVTEPTLEELLTGLDWRLLRRRLEGDESVASEVWRTFLWLMAAALVVEALLCLPSGKGARSGVATR